ncbi:MAG: TRAM domain-containing protein [Verrucomicrobiae bacterium]|nr:TRAM domain-containing protein [Verrucomicrobiae bacterium]
MNTSLTVIRALFLSLCVLAGYAVSQVQPDLVHHPSLNAPPALFGILVGFGFGGLLIAIDEMLKGFSLQAFSAATFGLVLGTIIAWLIDRSEIFVYVDQYPVRWLIRLTLFIGFSYIGMVLAMRSNREDFFLIIPYVRFSPRDQPEKVLLLDTSVIIDGRIADLIDARFLEGVVVVPRFVLKELQTVADSADPLRRERGRRGLEMLSRIQRNEFNDVKIQETSLDAGVEPEDVDNRLVRLAKLLDATLYTNDFNLGKIAELQHVRHVNLNELAVALKPVILPGESLRLKIAREGKEKHQGVGYLGDGTMIVVNHARARIGDTVEVVVSSLLQNTTGTMVFADLKNKENGEQKL